MNWLDNDDSVKWEFTISKPGKFNIDIASFEVKIGHGRNRKAVYEGGHKMEINLADKKLDFTIDPKINTVEKPSPYYKDIVSHAGLMQIDKPGKYQLTLKPISLVRNDDIGFTLRWLKLKPAK